MGLTHKKSLSDREAHSYTEPPHRSPDVMSARRWNLHRIHARRNGLRPVARLHRAVPSAVLDKGFELPIEF